ncbi:thiamine pyrophosphate-dependent dehydrogenase E1 component subunit alpha [Aciduricibacillus chroicocephali]|uniref:2-oxoisovalerate dehydrogenase subunit alpha n=1 Tax=Aciduricibacillus chroicocephali TaxID=3054939 RepID=A0ABY9KSJ3_9BACI|nr:thiamine pyrophosphate-dependent dehydrogenase E1 component subunit alpha [Bacillaceae bacterium 44XB]
MAEKRHEALGLTDQDVLEMYRVMLSARKVDERMWLLNRAGKIPFVVSCQGQEGAQVGAAFALDRSQDYLAPYYRDVAMVMAFGMTIKELMLSAFAKADDPNSGGRQMPGHFGSKKYRILSGSSPVTTQLPHAVGTALAAKMQKKDFVTLTALGEGSTNQGDFHEGLNFAAVHKLPVITFVENNQYAISVPVSKQYACERISDRAIGYGMPGYTVDGNDPLAVYEVMKKARDRAAAGEGPTLVEALVSRLTAHSSDDDHRLYREASELETLKESDSLAKFSTYLRECGVLNDEKETAMAEEIDKLVNEGTEYAEKAAFGEPASALRHVYAEQEEN